MKRLYSIILLLFSAVAYAQTNIVPDDVELQVLKNMYDSLGGSSWTTKTNWPTPGNWPATATSAQFGTWYGVTVANGDITQISLGTNHLVGTIPISISKLSKLTNLSLQSNQIGGTIPPQLGRLSNLTSLLLWGNYLTGTIPSELGNLTNLNIFYLYSNKLSGALPSSLGALTKITYFDVHSNLLSGTVPSIFSGMTSLSTLTLIDNQFTGTLPPLRGATIDVSINKFTGAFPSIGSSVIYSVTGSTNYFTSLPSSMSGWTNITALVMSNNELTTLPSAVTTLPNRSWMLMQFDNNRLDFSSLELLTSSQKVVSPQKTINDVSSATLTVGSPFVLTARTPGANTTINWQKQDASGAWVSLTNDQDSNMRTYTRTSAVSTEQGVYRWTSTSTNYGSFTISSDPITVKTTAAFALDNWCFQYRYDARKRMVQKRVPGADWVYMVYDNRDRLVLTQDGNQRANNLWSFTKYDEWNRPILTGIKDTTAAVSQATMQTVVDNFYLKQSS